jgi:hypothetical protein
MSDAQADQSPPNQPHTTRWREMLPVLLGGVLAIPGSITGAHLQRR